MLSPTTAPDSAALATDEVFVLSPVTIDGVSITAGVLCLVTPGGETVRVPVDRERIGAVARALMTHPAVLLLAREGVTLPQALPVPGNRLPVDTARTYADGVNDAAAAVARVALGYAHDTLTRTVADECQDAIAAVRGRAPKAPAPLTRATADDVATFAQQLHDAHRHREWNEVPRIIKALDDIAEAGRKAPAAAFVAACHAQSVHATERAAALEEVADRMRLELEYLRDAVRDLAENARHPTTPAGMFDDRTIAALRALADRVAKYEARP